MTLLGNAEVLVLPPGFDSSTLDSALVRFGNRTFFELEAHQASSNHVPGPGYFRHPDPDFGLPEAFRRPRQARLNFRFAF